MRNPILVLSQNRAESLNLQPTRVKLFIVLVFVIGGVENFEFLQSWFYLGRSVFGLIELSKGQLPYA